MATKTALQKIMAHHYGLSCGICNQYIPSLTVAIDGASPRQVRVAAHHAELPVSYSFINLIVIVRTLLRDSIWRSICSCSYTQSMEYESSNVPRERCRFRLCDFNAIPLSRRKGKRSAHVRVRIDRLLCYKSLCPCMTSQLKNPGCSLEFAINCHNDPS